MNPKIIVKIKTAKFLWPVAFIAATVSANCQEYSQNVVGYYNLQLYAGDNLIANQFDAGTTPDNSLNTILNQNSASGGVPEGTTFTEFDPANGNFDGLTSVYDTVNGWSINYTLGFGQGGLLNAPSSFVNTFIGSVWSGYNAGTGMWTPPLVTGTGWQLLSSYVPISDPTFYDIVGRDPHNGEAIKWLDAATQVYTTSTYENGQWNNGGFPDLNLGQSALFDLEAVPEPTVYNLIGAGLLLLGAFRKYAFK